MLQHISVRNFAIIENIEVDFQAGMTALTGETGAGKSLLIDAIGLLLGDRATSDIVRTGSDKAVVEGVFYTRNKQINAILDDLDASSEGTLIIRRQVTPTNNNIIKVNGQIITLKQLRDITELLADIHTQHDTHRLINPDTYLQIIDGFNHDTMNELKTSYRKAYLTFKNEQKTLSTMQHEYDSLIERYDLMQFQVEELETYNLKIGEIEDIQKEVKTMKHFDEIYTKLNEIMEHLETTNAIDHLYDISKSLDDISKYNEEYGQLKSRFSEAYYDLSDAKDTIQDSSESMDFDPREMDRYQERLNDLDRLQRKYKKTIPELIEYLEVTKDQLSKMEHHDKHIEKQKSVVISSFKTLSNHAKNIHDKRQEIASFIEKRLLETLTDLELKKVDFSIDLSYQVTDSITDSQFFEDGADTVEFYMSTNVGEPLKSLSKTASGGEMSRIMLGLKTLLASSLDLSLMIFDEIDSGVSGYVANQVAKKMRQIATSTQVICITHIPQVAAMSDHHLFIQKDVIDGRTRANLHSLNQEERIQELAQMISGEEVSSAAISSAKALLKIKSD